MKSQPMVDQIVSGHVAYRDCHSSFYESNRRNEYLPILPVCNYLVWSIILQGYSLRNVVLSLKTFHTGVRIY